MIVAFAVGFAFLILAVINAAFSQPPEDFVLPRDNGPYDIPKLLLSEGFYRSLLINIAFLGIATATSGFEFGSSTHFNIPASALLALLLNLAWGFFGGLFIQSDSDAIRSRDRGLLIAVLIAIGIALYIFSIVTVYHVPTPDTV